MSVGVSVNSPSLTRTKHCVSDLSLLSFTCSAHCPLDPGVYMHDLRDLDNEHVFDKRC